MPPVAHRNLTRLVCVFTDRRFDGRLGSASTVAISARLRIVVQSIFREVGIARLPAEM